MSCMQGLYFVDILIFIMKTKIVVLVLLVCVTVFFSILSFNQDIPSDTSSLGERATTTVSAPDPACDGEKNEYYDLGYGVEHVYEGELIPGQKVSITLSCDHQKLIVRGAVNQTISGDDVLSDVEKAEPHESIELADTHVGTDVVSVGSDYNFDGYNDISSVAGDGSGWQAVDTYFIFLYNPKTKKFEYNKQLGELENISLDPKKKEIYQFFGYREDGFRRDGYAWSAQGVLYPTYIEVCLSDRKKDTVAPTSFTHRITTYNESGATVQDLVKKTKTADVAVGCSALARP